MILLTLPLPPSSNKRVVPAVNRKTGKPFLRRNEKDSDYFETVRRIFVLQRLRQQLVPRGPMRMHLDVWVPAYNYDSTNRLKTLEDSLEALAYENDFQIITHHIERWLFNRHKHGAIAPAPAAPGVIVGIETLARDERTAHWFASFPLTRSGEPGAENESVAKVEVRELATTPKEWARRGLLTSAVIRYPPRP